MGWLRTAMLVLAWTASLEADEGMWLPDAPPLERLRERYGFVPSPEWLERVRRSAVRFNSGGSGAFISADGLVITNHHVGLPGIQRLSDGARDLVKDGFLARTRAEELAVPGFELNVLVSIEDVTMRINAAVQPGATAAEAAAARRAARAALEKESLAAAGLRSDVVALFRGARYHLYRYKKYTDVRLVFAPEASVAFFGGDTDNFEFPRHCLDFCFFRAYEDGRPARVEQYLAWTEAGVSEGDLVFVAGHPGATRRLGTLAELEYLRDRHLPQALASVKNTEALLAAWSGSAAENAYQARAELVRLGNLRKAYEGELAALQSPRVFERKLAEEKRLQEAARANPGLACALSAWPGIARAQAEMAGCSGRYELLERGLSRRDRLLAVARLLYRFAEEKAKPERDRLREYRDSNRASLERALLADGPGHDGLEQVLIESFLAELVMVCGRDSSLVEGALAGCEPRERAARLVAGTRLGSMEERRRLFNGDVETMKQAADSDPLLGLVRLLDGESRAVRRIMEEQGEVKVQAQAEIAKVRYALDGDAVYPDATATLRLAYGTVAGYDEAGGRPVAPFTTLGGLYDCYEARGGREPFGLPRRWLEARGRVGRATPMNFACTADTIGGNSGSPVIDRGGRFVGLAFDINRQALGNDFAYDEGEARAVAVDARAIVEALRVVYGADELVAELLAGRR